MNHPTFEHPIRTRHYATSHSPLDARVTLRAAVQPLELAGDRELLPAQLLREPQVPVGPLLVDVPGTVVLDRKRGDEEQPAGDEEIRARHLTGTPSGSARGRQSVISARHTSYSHRVRRQTERLANI